MNDSSDSVFLGGYFANVGETDADGLAAVDASDGANLERGDPSIEGEVWDISHDPDGTFIQAGGDFDEAAQSNFDNAMLLEDDDLTQIHAGWLPDPDDRVNAVQYFEDGEEDPRYLLGGEFSSVDSTPQEYFAVLDEGGELSPGSPDADGPVQAIDFYATGGRFAVGGEFGEFDGEPREGLAMLDLDGEELDTQETSVAIDGVVLGLSQDEDHVAVAGTFQNVDGEYHAGIVLLDAETLEPVW